MSQDERGADFWHGRRVFITGCTGFLGSWLTAALLERGASVVGLVREREPQSELVRSGLIHRDVKPANIVITDNDLLRVAIPVGTAGLNTVFDDGARTLLFEGTVKIGSQSLSTDSVPISSPAGAPVTPAGDASGWSRPAPRGRAPRKPPHRPRCSTIR